MNWIEVSLEVDGEAAEAVADVLRRYGHQGVAIEQAGFPVEVWPDEIPPADRLIVRAYFPDDDQAEAKQQKLREALWHMGRLYPMPEPVFAVVNDEDWAEAWKKHYHPLRLGRRLYIRPEWSDAPGARPDDIILVLDPGMAFGTGTHPTTQLCLIALEELLADWPAVDVLDLGCGSGILGIAALKLGASKALMLDIDDLAIKSTLENAAYNGVQDRITAQEGSLDTLKTTSRHFDLLLCNILAKAIIEMCGQGLGDVLRAGGKAVFSGIIQDQADDVEAALRQTGLDPYKRRTLGEWVAIEARRISQERPVMTPTVHSKNGVPIRLPEERWLHIAEQHGELEAMRQAVLDTVAEPERVLAGNAEELLALREVEVDKWLVVVYRELQGDGFVITAFLTRRIRSLERRQQVWP